MRNLPVEALAKLNLIAYMSTTLNNGHAWGTAKETLVLPVLPRDEEPQPTTQESMFSYVRLSDGGRARHEGPRSEVSVLAALGRGVLGDAGRGQLERPRKPPANPRVDRRPDSGLRADGRHRSHARRVPHRRPPHWTRRTFRPPPARPGSTRSRLPTAPAPKRASCG